MTDYRVLELLEDLKINEVETETETEIVAGTRKPTTRDKRRKQTAYAKRKLAETKRVREMRSIPYSAFFKNAKGKSHPDRAWDWLNMPTVQERRRTERLNAEIALYLAE